MALLRAVKATAMPLFGAIVSYHLDKWAADRESGTPIKIQAETVPDRGLGPNWPKAWWPILCFQRSKAPLQGVCVGQLMQLCQDRMALEAMLR
jgi:hypothetical protein